MTWSATIDPEVPNAARIYHMYLGGKHFFPVDKAAGDEATRNFVGGAEGPRRQCRANRDFLVRGVNYLVKEAGIRQFIDIGTGIPDDDNVPAAAQAADPTCRVVSVDNDETVLAHADELLQSTPEGATAFVDADMRRPAKIVREASKTLDFDKPIAVILAAVLHLVADTDDIRPGVIVQNLVDAVAPGSYLLISHLADDIPPHVEAVREMAAHFNDRAITREVFSLRARPDIAAFFNGLELVDPGIVPVHEWRPDRPGLHSAPLHGGIARK